MIAHAPGVAAATPGIGFGSTADRFQDRIDALERRLEDGDRRITEASVRGENVAAWEEFWIDLLHEYETLCDELTELGVSLPARTAA